VDDRVSRAPEVTSLGVLALLIGLAIALPAGIYSAVRQDTAADYVGRSVAIIGLAMPNFWLALMVVIYPAIWLGWAPPLELVAFTEDPLGNLAVFIIPSLILGTASAAATMRMTRTMMLEVLRQDYVRTAWSKGMGERAVVLRHALKNALIPVVSLIGLQLPIRREFMEVAPRLALWPGLALTITVYSLNMFGDAVRDLLDPRSRGASGVRGGAGRLGADPSKSHHETAVPGFAWVAPVAGLAVPPGRA